MIKFKKNYFLILFLKVFIYFSNVLLIDKVIIQIANHIINILFYKNENFSGVFTKEYQNKQ